MHTLRTHARSGNVEGRRRPARAVEEGNEGRPRAVRRRTSSRRTSPRRTSSCHMSSGSTSSCVMLSRVALQLARRVRAADRVDARGVPVARAVLGRPVDPVGAGQHRRVPPAGEHQQGPGGADAEGARHLRDREAAVQGHHGDGEAARSARASVDVHEGVGRDLRRVEEHAIRIAAGTAHPFEPVSAGVCKGASFVRGVSNFLSARRL